MALTHSDIFCDLRSCLGAKFSQVEGVTALSMIMQRYRVSLPPDPDIKKLLQQKTLLTLQPANPFNLLLQKRDD
jgi:cytochrome P450